MKKFERKKEDEEDNDDVGRGGAGDAGREQNLNREGNGAGRPRHGWRGTMGGRDLGCLVVFNWRRGKNRLEVGGGTEVVGFLVVMGEEGK